MYLTKWYFSLSPNFPKNIIYKHIWINIPHREGIICFVWVSNVGRKNTDQGILWQAYLESSRHITQGVFLASFCFWSTPIFLPEKKSIPELSVAFLFLPLPTPTHTLMTFCKGLRSYCCVGGFGQVQVSWMSKKQFIFGHKRNLGELKRKENKTKTKGKPTSELPKLSKFGCSICSLSFGNHNMPFIPN